MNAPGRSGTGPLRRPGKRYLLLLAVLAPAASYAASRPVILDATYVEPTPVVSGLAKGASPCRVHIVQLVDGRRSPEMIGMLGGKPVLAPPDRTAWLLSVIGGLNARGVAVDFNNPSAESPGIINANITLQTAWVSAVQVSLDNSVVFKVQAKGIDARTVDQYYRGSSSRMNWASGDGEIKSGINIAFSRALDAIARDLAGLCDAKKT
jgi:hypothetical protein